MLLEPLTLIVSMYAIQKNCFEDFFLWCEKLFLEFEGPLSPIDATPPKSIAWRLFDATHSKARDPIKNFYLTSTQIINAYRFSWLFI